MDRRLTLITGGARSGKSSFAVDLARKRGGSNVVFIATAEPGDQEMRARIAAHRAARPPGWTTIETRDQVAQALRAAPPMSAVLLDCVALWTSNVLHSHRTGAAQAMDKQIDELIDWFRAADVVLIVVTNEVGMGLVPATELGRAFRDLLGSVNRRLAAASDEVYFLVAGLPMELKKHR